MQVLIKSISQITVSFNPDGALIHSVASLSYHVTVKIGTGNYEEHLNIEAGSRNMGYKRLFERFFSSSVSEIILIDPDIQSSDHIGNLVHFCEVCIKLSDNQLKKLSVTTKSTNNPDQRTMFSQLTKSLRFQDVVLVYQLVDDDNLTRKIEFNNGWEVQINQGLNYLEVPNEFSPGIHNFDLRSSLATKIDMFYSKK